MEDATYFDRCLELASKASSQIYPNPRVGCVIVHQGKIIGEGFHRIFGSEHAEAAAIASVEDKELLKNATLYVNLEPCNHHGHTPPCTELIIRCGIPRVGIGSKDPNPRVSGAGIERLKAHGVKVFFAEEQAPSRDINKVFFTNQLYQRPYIVLKWAETNDGFIGAFNSIGKAVPLAISGIRSRRKTHQLRAYHHAIMIGKNTALIDDPLLTTRHYYGQHPIRIIWDMHQHLPGSLRLFADGGKNILISQHKKEGTKQSDSFQPSQWEDLNEIGKELYAQHQIASILVEGGRNLLQQFIAQDLYDEVHLFRGNLRIGKGTQAPKLPEQFHFQQQSLLGEDSYHFFQRKVTSLDT